MCVHLVNTLFLLAALALTAWFAAGQRRPPRLTGRGGSTALWLVTLALLVLAGASGAVAALGDTLFPARSWAEALAQDLSPASHLLCACARPPDPGVARRPRGAAAGLALARRWARAAGALALAQTALGALNLALLARCRSSSRTWPWPTWSGSPPCCRRRALGARPAAGALRGARAAGLGRAGLGAAVAAEDLLEPGRSPASSCRSARTPGSIGCASQPCCGRPCRHALSGNASASTGARSV
jgi:hypothetical protein